MTTPALVKSSVNIGCKLLPKAKYNPGNGIQVELEKVLNELAFNVFKFNQRKRPDKSKVVIIPTFAEFGCESLIPLYCIPRFLQKQYMGHYSIAIGWYGRDYLYKHLVDEYWELKEEYQHLREYCLAFHNSSHNLKLLEDALKDYGKVIPNKDFGNIATFPKYLTCPSGKKCNGVVNQFKEYQECYKCRSRFPVAGIFQHVEYAKRTAHWIPMPSQEKMNFAKDYLPDNAVGVTARNRKTYGRNLKPEFYQNLINLLRDLGYNPVWLGEKCTTLPCPDPTVLDFSRDQRSRDLETTLAIVSQLKFTIQFWTASTRLAGLVGTPFILFESPDQIWGEGGQEGYRLHLTTKGEKKIIAAHYLSTMDNPEKALSVIRLAVNQIEQKDYSTMVGVVENEQVVRNLIHSSRQRISWF